MTSTRTHPVFGFLLHTCFYFQCIYILLVLFIFGSQKQSKEWHGSPWMHSLLFLRSPIDESPLQLDFQYYLGRSVVVALVFNMLLPQALVFLHSLYSQGRFRDALDSMVASVRGIVYSIGLVYIVTMCLGAPIPFIHSHLLINVPHQDNTDQQTTQFSRDLHQHTFLSQNIVNGALFAVLFALEALAPMVHYTALKEPSAEPPIITHILDSPHTRVRIRAQCIIFFTWLSAVVIPLDWERWYQEYPICAVFGMIIGCVVGSSLSELTCILRALRAQKPEPKQKPE